MKALLNWLDDRTGYRALVHEALYENIPGGARWRYVWGSTLVFAFSVQAITGIFLWMAYSPSAQTAWESVFFIQYDVQGGWLLRGLHHFMAQAMVVLLALHLLQVVIDGAYRAPREVNFWIGLILMQIVLGLSLTGYLLPWDQKGYWATQVATKLMGAVPWAGPTLQRLVVGGPAYGHHTLTRFFALHAGVLPALLVFFLVAHIYVFRRHGIHARKPQDVPDATFWPDQVLKDAVACLAVLVVVLGLNVWHGAIGDHAGQRPGEYLGADLGAPADSSNSYSAARPEWYFLFLFQFLKYFHGETEVYGAIVIPSAVMGLMFLMPLVGRWKLGHGFNIAFLIALLAGAGGLTVQALLADRKNEDYQRAVLVAEENAQRVRQLAFSPTGIPSDGAISLLRDDPYTAGPLLFKQHCATCHSYDDMKTDRLVKQPELTKPDAQGKRKFDRASNLYGFATREWLTGMLDPEQIAGPRYFGNTKHHDGEMLTFVKDTVAELDEAEKANLKKALVALSAQAHLKHQAELDAGDAVTIKQGTELLKHKVGCTDCHRFEDAGTEGTAPELTGYGSREWLTAFISNPGQKRFYGENHLMPPFGETPNRPHAELSAKELGLLVDWFRGEWYEPSSSGEQKSEPPAHVASHEPTPEKERTATAAPLASGPCAAR